MRFHLHIINYITSLHVLFQFINLEAEKKSGIINFYLIIFSKLHFHLFVYNIFVLIFRYIVHDYEDFALRNVERIINRYQKIYSFQFLF